MVVSIKFTSRCVAKRLIKADVARRSVATAVRAMLVDDKFDCESRRHCALWLSTTSTSAGDN